MAGDRTATPSAPVERRPHHLEALQDGVLRARARHASRLSAGLAGRPSPPPRPARLPEPPVDALGPDALISILAITRGRRSCCSSRRRCRSTWWACSCIATLVLSGDPSTPDQCAGQGLRPATALITIAAMFDAGSAGLIRCRGPRTHHTLDVRGHRRRADNRRCSSSCSWLTVAVSVGVPQQHAHRGHLPADRCSGWRSTLRHGAQSKLLLPMSYASILGGTCTLIGTSHEPARVRRWRASTASPRWPSACSTSRAAGDDLRRGGLPVHGARSAPRLLPEAGQR